MSLKNLFLLAFSFILILFSPSVVGAQSVSPNPSSQNQSQKLTDLQTKCDSAVTERLTSLNNDLTRLNGLSKLSSDLKGQFSNQINNNIKGLNGQKAKCDSDSDLSSLKTDYKNVFLNFRIYAVFLPQTNISVASDTMDITVDQLQTLYTKLQTRFSQSGNPSNLNALFADMQAKINDAKTQYTNATNAVSSLTPQSFNTNPSQTQSTLQNARNDIKTGAQDLKTAFQDAKNIRAGLKPSPSTSPH